VDTVVRPQLEPKYDWVEVVPYAGMTKAKVTKWIESIRAMEYADYVFLADNDESPCVSTKKAALVQQIKSLQPARVSVVVEEIESWYVAGLTAQGRERLEIGEMENTNSLDKESFDELRQETFESRIDWMIEMLRYYSFEDGLLRNSSLQYFASKFLPSPEEHNE